MENPITLSVKKGTTSKRVQIFIGDSSVTTGAGLVGLLFNTASLTAYYFRDGDTAATSITLASMTVGTWVSGGFKVIDGTNMPGCYEIGIPDACLATGANFCKILLKGAANMRPTEINIELTSIDIQDAVRGGMTALPNANAAAAGGLWILGSNNTAAITIGNLTLSAFQATTFATSGAMTLAALTVNTNVLVTGTTTLTGTVHMGGAFTVSGLMTLNALTVTNDTNWTGDFNVGGNLLVNGSATWANAFNINGLNIVNAFITNTAGNKPLYVLSSDNTAAMRIEGTSGNAFEIAGGGGGKDIYLAGDGKITGGITGNIVGNLTGAITGNITGNLSGSVGSIASGGIVAASFAVDSITASALKTDAVTEITTPILNKLPSALIAGRLDVTVGDYQSGNEPLQSTVLGRSLNITAAGNAGIDWATVENQTSTVNLSNTRLHLVDTVTTVTNNPNAGNGAYSVQATVTDGTNPLQQATVRITSGINTFSSVTDGSGHVTFALDAGTYTVTATKGGYTMTPTTRTVTGNNAGTLYTSPIVLTATVVPVAPTDPAICLVYGYARDVKTNAVLKGVQIQATLKPGIYAKANGILVGREVKTSTDNTGLFQLNLIKNSSITPTGSSWRIYAKEAGINKDVTLTTDTLDLQTLLP